MVREQTTTITIPASLHRKLLGIQDSLKQKKAGKVHLWEIIAEKFR